jgi:hypothetical protein
MDAGFAQPRGVVLARELELLEPLHLGDGDV